MVDMNMLLITFFMVCTTLAKPQMMDLAMPGNKESSEDEQEEVVAKVDEKKTVTLLLGGRNVIYYYLGQPNYDSPDSLLVTDYSPEGLRRILTRRNRAVINRIADLRMKKQRKEISEEEWQEEIRTIKSDRNGQVVLIKPTDESIYENLVDVLDEMQITGISVYTLAEPTDGDKMLIHRYESDRLQPGSGTGELALHTAAADVWNKPED